MPDKHKAGKSDGRHRQGRARGGLHMSPLPWIALALVAIAAAAFILLQSRPLPVTEITAAQAYEKYQAGAFFLDVRTEAEYAAAHIANSVLIPLEELETRLDEVPRDRDVVVICRSGVRSKEGATILRRAGFGRVSCLTGGLLAWNQAGYPLEADE